MKKHTIHQLFGSTIFSILMVVSLAKPPESKPENYLEIKTQLDAYALSDDMLDRELIAARATLRSRGDEAIPALIVLFKENPTDEYRAAIVDALEFNRGKKNEATAFLTAQLSSKVAQWEGQLWVAGAIRFVAANDSERGRNIARKALESPSDFVKHAAIKALTAVGTEQDIELLKAFQEQRKSLKYGPNDGILTHTNTAIETIKKRAPASKP